MTTDAEKTQWFIAEAKKYDINVKKTTNDAVYFDMPQTMTTGMKRPYFMIWTGKGKDSYWHAEFGHWYFPKTLEERRDHPTTAHYPDRELAEAIKEYAQAIKKETAL